LTPQTPLSLEQFRALVRGFAPLWRASRRFRERYSDLNDAVASTMLQEIGMAAIEFLDAIPHSRERIRTTGRYLEELMNLVLMSGFDYDPERFALLEHLIDDIEKLVKAEMIDAPFLTSILIDDAGSVEALPEALDRLDEPRLVAVTIRTPFERLARVGRNLERIGQAGKHPSHTVFFVMDDDGPAEQSARFLSDALSGYPWVGRSVWEGLLHTIAPEV
jgi:hypothetical protein